MSDERAADVDLGLEISKGIIAKIVQAVLGFAGTVIFARVLGPTDFGGYYLLLSLVSIVDRPVSGMSSATKKRYAESDAPKAEILGFQTVFNVGYVIVASLGAVLLHSQLASYTALPDAAIYFAVLLTGLTLFTSLQAFLASLGRVGIQSWIDTFRSVLTLALQLALVAVGLGAAGMVFGLFFATIAVLPLTYHYLRTIPELPVRETVSSVWSFARYSIPASFVGKSYDRLDILLLGFLASPMSAAWYEVAYKLTIPAMFVGGLISAGLMANVSDKVSRGESIDDDINNSLAFASSIAIPVLFGALAIPESIVVTAYGPDYRNAALLLVGLALYRVVQTQTDVLTGILQGLDKPDVQMRASALALGINIPLGIGLYWEFGALGVVMATVVSETVRYVFFNRSVSREVTRSLLPRAFFEQVTAGVVMYVAVEQASGWLVVRSWVDLLTLVSFGAVVYFLVLSAISYHFRATARGVLKQIIKSYDMR